MENNSAIKWFSSFRPRKVTIQSKITYPDTKVTEIYDTDRGILLEENLVAMLEGQCAYIYRCQATEKRNVVLIDFDDEKEFPQFLTVELFEPTDDAIKNRAFIDAMAGLARTAAR